MQALLEHATSQLLRDLGARDVRHVDISHIVAHVGLGPRVLIDADVWRLIVCEPVPHQPQPTLLPAQAARIIDIVCAARDAERSAGGALFDNWVLRPGAEQPVRYHFAMTRSPAHEDAWLICQSSL